LRAQGKILVNISAHCAALSAGRSLGRYFTYFYLLTACLKDHDFYDFQDLPPWRTLGPGGWTGDSVTAAACVAACRPAGRRGGRTDEFRCAGASDSV
jgi:hypothetical protein